jgi:hypothetical protein
MPSGYALPPRAAELCSQVVGDEIVVLNRATQQAHALAGLVAAVWHATETGTWTGHVDANFHAALAELIDAGLLVEPAGIARRSMLARGGLVAVGVGIASVGLPMVDAAASFNTGTPTIALSPTSGPRGTLVTVTGSNFATVAGSVIQTVTIGALTVTPSNTTITATGTFSFTFTVPAGAPLGLNTVSVTDNHNNTGTAGYQVTQLIAAPASLPRNGGGAQSTTLTGSGFAANSAITITRGGDFSAATIPAGITTNASGVFTTTITNINYPNGSGSGTFTATDASGNTATVTIPH